MITFPCDNCAKMLEVDDELSGQKVKCPYCGDVNSVPRVASVAGAVKKPDRAAEAGLPPANGPEQDVLSVRPAMLRSRPISYLLLCLGMAGGIGVGLWQLSLKQPIPAYFAFAASGLSLLLMMIWKLSTLDAGLKISTKRTVERRGLLSRATSEVLHADIRNVQAEQSFWQRVWNVGTLSISSAAEHEDEIRMMNVPKPDKVREIIDLYRPM